jgi:hypothetical protein
VIAVFSLAAMITTASATQRVDPPTTIERPPGFSRIEAPVYRGGVSAGKPSKLAMVDAWITSDLLPDDFSTDVIWFSNESLTLLAYFFTPIDKTVKATFILQDQSGATILNDVFSFTPDPGFVQGVLYDIGPLPVDAYRATIKYKQGKKTVGQQIWMLVSSP